MNFMTISVSFLLLVEYFNGLLACSPSSFRRPSKAPGVHNGIFERHSNGRTSVLVGCPDTQTLKGLTGEWDYYCSDNPNCLYVSKKEYSSNSTGNINHICTRGGYIMYIFVNFGLDSRFSIICCHDNQTKSHEDCYWSGWQNCFGSSFKYWVPDGYYMAGIRSEYNSSVKNGYSRIWDFYVCK